MHLYINTVFEYISLFVSIDQLTDRSIDHFLLISCWCCQMNTQGKW